MASPEHVNYVQLICDGWGKSYILVFTVYVFGGAFATKKICCGLTTQKRHPFIHTLGDDSFSVLTSGWLSILKGKLSSLINV